MGSSSSFVWRTKIGSKSKLSMHSNRSEDQPLDLVAHTSNSGAKNSHFKRPVIGVFYLKQQHDFERNILLTVLDTSRYNRQNVGCDNFSVLSVKKFGQDASINSWFTHGKKVNVRHVGCACMLLK